MNKITRHTLIACAAALLLATMAALPAAEPTAHASKPTQAAPDDQRRTGYVLDTSTNPFIQTSDGQNLGDPMPVYWDGVWHLYALSAPVGKVVHFTSNDLVKWVEHQPAMIHEGIATGTVLRHENKYFLFYTDEPAQTIRLVISDNPWEFDHSKSRLVAQADGKTYRKGWFRDAYVFYNEEERLWWMLFEGRCPEVCAGLFKSKDLLKWTLCDPIFKAKARAYGSCPQVVKHADLWYLAIQDMGNCYYSAQGAQGSWTDRGQYLSVMVEAASRFATDGQRQITWGWLCDWVVKPKKEIRSYGGPLCIGREIVFKKDGAMGVRALPELSAAIRKAARHVDLGSARNLSGQWKIDSAQQILQCQGESGGTVLLALPEKNPDYYFEAELEFDSPRTIARIVVRSSDTADRGYGLALNPADKTIAIRGFTYISDGKVLNDKPYTFAGKNKVSLQIFVCGNHLEAFVDDQECLSALTVDRSCHNVAIEISGGSATIRKPLLHYFSSTSRRSG